MVVWILFVRCYTMSTHFYLRKKPRTPCSVAMVPDRVNDVHISTYPRMAY